MLSTLISQIRFSQEELKKFCEIGLMLIIILSRWLLPRGSITRDQLSLLLLEYVACDQRDYVTRILLFEVTSVLILLSVFTHRQNEVMKKILKKVHQGTSFN